MSQSNMLATTPPGLSSNCSIIIIHNAFAEVVS